MIRNAGELIEYITAAVQEHGATPLTEITVRIGSVGAEYRISGLQGVQDQRGFSLLLQTEVLPKL